MCMYVNVMMMCVCVFVCMCICVCSISCIRQCDARNDAIPNTKKMAEANRYACVFTFLQVTSQWTTTFSMAIAANTMGSTTETSSIAMSPFFTICIMCVIYVMCVM